MALTAGIPESIGEILDSDASPEPDNGASLYLVNTDADLSENGWRHSRGVMVNYLYDQTRIESNHEHYIGDGKVRFNDRLKPLQIKS